MKNFDEETMDIPRIGMRVLADEMHRTLHLPINTGRLTRKNAEIASQGLKIFFATEWLTRYGYATVMNGNLNSNKLRNILLETRAALCATEPETTEIIFRMDDVSTHATLVSDKRLKNDRIKVLLKDKNTGSKNLLAPLDARMRTLSDFLIGEASEPKIKVSQK